MPLMTRPISKLTRPLTLLFLVFAAGCASMLAGMAKMASPAGQKTTTLSDVVATGAIESNLAPKELGTISQSVFSGWQSGGDLLFLMFSKKSGPGFYQIDGTVTVDGKPVAYESLANYSVASGPNPAPRKVEITTTSGEKASFVIEPNKNKLKVVSINGQKAKASLDLTKDITIELDAPQVPEGTMLKVSLAINQIGVKSFYDVCYVRYQPKLTIPAGAFRNINIKPGANLLFSYDNSFLTVAAESAQTATSTGPLTSLRYTSAYSDGMFVTVATPPALNPGLSVKGTTADMNYEVFKPGAFLSRPAEQIKTFGVVSLAIRGTTYHQSVETSTSSNTLVMGGIANTTTTTTTKTTTLEFPKQSDATWDALLEDLYPAFTAVLKSELGAQEVPVDKITGTDAYTQTVAFAKDDSNTTVEFARSFRKTKVLSAFMPVSEGYGANGVNERIMNEAGADALVTLTLDLEISASAKDDKILMTPKLGYEIVGKANGSNTSTKYFAGTVASTKGVSFKKDITLAQLQAIVRKSDLMTVFGKAVKEIKAKEKDNGDYVVVWNLQK